MQTQSKLILEKTPFPGYHRLTWGRLPTHEDDQYYALEGDSLKAALAQYTGQSIYRAVNAYAPKPHAHTHILITEESVLQGCRTKFYEACKENRIRIIRFVDDETFFDYVSRQYFAFYSEREWHALDDEPGDREWWSFCPVSFEEGEERRKEAERKKHNTPSTPPVKEIPKAPAKPPVNTSPKTLEQRIDLLAKLKDLRQAGVLTQEEFEQKALQLMQK